jgi:tetratricopeptide (TPR) repeat protein
VIDLLKGYFGIGDRDAQPDIREMVTGKVLTLDRALEATLPALLGLLDVSDDSQWQALEPSQRRQRMFDAVKRLLLRESQVQPLLVVFEDLHWIDSETQGLLDTLVESLPPARLLLLVNYRPEYEHRWGNKTFYTQVRLDPLASESALEMLQGLLGQDDTIARLPPVLIERTEGNPFFLEESVRALVETGALVGGPGAYRLVAALTDIQVPPTVQTILAARIDRLSPEAKRLLQSAAVIGKHDVPFALLAAISDETEETVRRGLAHLQAAEFLYETRLFPDLEYTFKHALTHEVTYRGLLKDRRRALHGRTVEAVERLYPEHLGEHVERLAEHASLGEAWGKAATYFRQAGSKALARSSNREASAYFEEALSALSRLPQTHATLEQLIDVRFDLRSSLFMMGDFRKVEGHLREAEALARALDDQQRLGRVSAYLSGHHLATGSPASLVRSHAERVEAIGDALGDVSLQVVAQYYLVLAHHLSGDYRATESMCRKLVRFLEGERSRDRFGNVAYPAVLSRAYLARTLGERGAFDEGQAYGEEAVRLAEVLDHPNSLIFAYLNLSHLHSVRGQLDQTSRLLERAVEEARDRDITMWAPVMTASLGYMHARSGRSTEGISRLKQALTAFEASGYGYLHSISVAQLGEAYLLAGNVEDASTCAERAVMLSRMRGERGHEAWSLRLLGDIASYRNGPGEVTAEGPYLTARDLALELGMRPLIAHCHLGLGKLYRRTGQHAQAQEHLTTATTMYREMGMTYWLEQAESNMREST